MAGNPLTETIKWSVVPNGINPAGPNLKLSVLISPELSAAPGSGATGTLQDFPNFRDWPQALINGDLSWEVQVSPSNNSFTQRIGIAFNPAALNSKLWTELFPTSLVYGPPEPIQHQFRNLGVVSYPVSQVTGFLAGQYRQYPSLTDVPTLSDLKNVYGPISDVLVGVTAQNRLSKLKADRLARSKNGSRPHANDFSAATPAESFAAQHFYHLPGAATQPAPSIPEIDFHKALTFIGQHGVLQRPLGLVFDFEVPVKDVRLLTAGGNEIFVAAQLVTGPGGTPFGPGYSPVTPRTHCDVNVGQGTFEAHSTTGNINSRQLTVGDESSFLIHAIDFDGAGLRASTFATQIHLTEAPAAINQRYIAAVQPMDPATPMPPPTNRSNGLTLTQTNRGLTFAETLSRAFLLFDAPASAVPDLNAEDLVRGYVLDVLDASNNIWRSTAEWVPKYKTATQTINGPTSAPFSESSTQAPPRVQSDPNDESSQQANVSEVILRYNGWSNAVPRPGKVIQDSDSQLPQQGPFSQVRIDVAPPPGRLPALRFGHTYQMRARIIDVANNALPVSAGADKNDTLLVSRPMVYGRQEPISSPDIYSQSIPRLSESLQRLVIRDVDSGTPSVRALFPPRTSEPFAEWHGMFDTGSGGAINGSLTTYSEIVGREAAHYPDPPSDPATAPPTIPLTTPVPFLPDPLARGAVLTITNGTLVNQTIPFDFAPPSGGKWPNYRPFGLRLVPGNAAPNDPKQSFTVDSANRMVTLLLTEADTIVLTLVSTCKASDVPLFALGYAPGVNLDANAVALGQYWAITPEVQLELVYAVQKPLLTPEFASLPTPGRGAGDTFATVQGDLIWSPKSTSTIDLLADWADPVDNPSSGQPPHGPGTPNPNLRQTANSPVATLPSDTNSLDSTGTQDYSATDRFSVRHEFFDTKHRNVTYHGVATSEFSEFYPTGTDVKNATQNPILVDVLSSARPDSVNVAYVVPIYGWGLSHPNSRTTVSERSPSALRVFIERPWWSSGIDELLGVLTWPGAEPGTIFHFLENDARSKKKKDSRLNPILIGNPGVNGPIPDGQAQYVSDWGADPVFKSRALPSLHPRISSFPRALTSGSGLTIEENAGITVNVAGHPVSFDATRNLWYCDIAVNTGTTYTPMIKLALARYQPNSIQGVELGRIVLADIMSLEPGRTATVVRNGPRHLSSVTLSGYSYSKAAGARRVAPGEAELIIERRQTAVHDPTLGWEQVGKSIRMSPGGGRGSLTTWIARNIKLPKSGAVRLCVNQYEVLPTDNRKTTSGFYLLSERSRELRLLYQDLIPL